MDRNLREKFNEEVERYRKALTYYAMASEWERFEKKAGVLFDYVESVELTVLERRFFKIFSSILGLLIVVVGAVLLINGSGDPLLLNYKDQIIIMALVGAAYEVYFFIGFKVHVDAKRSRYRKRREQFIRNIEDDFKTVVVRSGA